MRGVRDIFIPGGGGGTGGNGSVNISAGTTNNNLTNVSFADANGVSFGINGSTITASVGVAGAGLTNIKVSAGTLSALRSDLTFNNSNGISFGLETNGIITGTVKTDYQSAGAYLTTAMLSNAATISNIKFSAGAQSGLRSDITYADSNGVSFGFNAGTITATVKTDYQSSNVNYLTSQSNQAAQGSNGSFTFQTLSFSNANGLSFGTSAGSAIFGSYTVPTVTNSSWTVSDNATSGTVACLAFTNLNGLTLSLSTGAGGSHTVVGSYTVPNVPAQTNQTIGYYAVGNTTGQSSSSTYDARTVSFDGAGNVSVGYSAGSIIISGGTAAAAPINFSAGTTSGNLGSVVFSNSNGVSFGLNGSTITATVATNYQSQGAYLTTAMQSNAATISNINLSAGTTSNNLSAFVLSNSNNVSFGLNGSTVTATVTVPAQTVQTVGVYAVGNTTGQSSSSTLDARTLSFDGVGVASIGFSGGSIVVSVPSGGGAGDGFNILAAGTQTANTTGTVLFQNSNGISFGMSNSSVITAAYTVPTVTNSSWTVSDNATSATVGRLAFTASNGLTLSLSTSNNGNHTVIGSYTVPTVTNSSWTVSDNGTSGSVARLAFTNLNGVTLSLSTGAAGLHTIVGSHNALTSQSTDFNAITLGGNTAGTTTFHATNNRSIFLNGGNNITLSGNGSTITISAAAQTTQSAIKAFGASNTGNTAGNTGVSTGVDWVIAGTNNITVSQSTAAGGPNTIWLSAPSPAGGAVNFSAGTTSGNLGSIVFSNSNGVSFGLNGSTITASAVGGGGGGVGIGITNSGNTAGTSGTVTTGNYYLVGSGAITLSQSSSGNNGTLTITVPQTSSLVGTQGISLSTNGSTISIGQNLATMWWPFNEAGNVVGQQGQSTLIIAPSDRVGPVKFDRVAFPVLFSNTNSTAGSITISMFMGLYTKNAGTLSLYASSSTSQGLTFSSTNNTSNQSGIRLMTMGWTTTVDDGRYYAGILSKTASAGANATVSQVLVSNLNSNFSGLLDVASNATNQWPPGMGIYSVQTASLPASIAFSQLQGTQSNAARPPTWFARSGTE